jgi:hypothetical protein
LPRYCSFSQAAFRDRVVQQGGRAIVVNNLGDLDRWLISTLEDLRNAR